MKPYSPKSFFAIYFVCLSWSSLLSVPLVAQSWQPLSQGLNNIVNGIYSFSGDLYATGYFDSAGTTAANGVAKWDGNNWSSLGSGIRPNGGYTLSDYNNELALGGVFDSAGTHAANNIARWNGVAWNPLRAGSALAVTALQTYHFDLYASGSFDTAGTGQNYFNLAKWDGSAWKAFGNTDGYVYAMAVFRNELWIGGAFQRVDDTSFIAESVIRWNGSSWADADSGFDGIPYSMVEYNNELYIAGDFLHSGIRPLNHIARWDGTSWQSVGNGTNQFISSLAVLNGELYAGGGFDSAGTVKADRIAKWDGNNWFPVDSGFDDIVISLAVHNAELYACGFFNSSAATPLRHIAKLNTGSNGIPNGKQQDDLLSVYPNPCVRLLTVETGKYPLQNSYLRILNLWGQELKKLNFNGDKIVVDITELPSGIYEFVLSEPDRSSRARVVIAPE